tara:strand:+ start:2506 stop:2730 length:225 start_codon:yes stop_codon:yes gene_type:complete
MELDMKRGMSAEELKRFALLKSRMKEENKNKSPKEKLSKDQIDRRARESVKMGNVNEHGYIVGAEWDSNQRKSK